VETTGERLGVSRVSFAEGCSGVSRGIKSGDGGEIGSQKLYVS